MAGLKDLYVKPLTNNININFVNIDDLVNTIVKKPFKTVEEIEGVKKMCIDFKRHDLEEVLQKISLSLDKDVE
jgi:hypothetical protein